VVTSITGPSAPPSCKQPAPFSNQADFPDPLVAKAPSLALLAYLTLFPSTSNYATNTPNVPVAYTLTTTSLLRKYTFLSDLPLTALPFAWRIAKALVYPASTTNSQDGGQALVANTWHRYLLTRAAFAQHPSQYTWDRNLYMILSRYVWFNDLKMVPVTHQSRTQNLSAR